MTDCQPLDYILPNSKDVPLAPLHLNGIKTKQPSCLKQLTFSGWNPPPGKRKMKGDLMYMHVITNEDKRYHLTASTRGFYINQSTDDTFNPKQDNSHKISHSLVDLLNNLSASFKKTFPQFKKSELKSIHSRELAHHFKFTAGYHLTLSTQSIGFEPRTRMRQS